MLVGSGPPNSSKDLQGRRTCWGWSDNVMLLKTILRCEMKSQDPSSNEQRAKEMVGSWSHSREAYIWIGKGIELLSYSCKEAFQLKKRGRLVYLLGEAWCLPLACTETWSGGNITKFGCTRAQRKKTKKLRKCLEQIRNFSTKLFFFLFICWQRPTYKNQSFLQRCIYFNQAFTEMVSGKIRASKLQITNKLVIKVLASEWYGLKTQLCLMDKAL